MTDVIVRPSGPLRAGTDCVSDIATGGGGSGANLACWLGRLGVPVRFAGRVGVAEIGAQQAAFRTHGVAARLGAGARPTGMVVAVIAADGERSFYTDRGANMELCAADLPPDLLDGVRLLHVSGYALFAPGPRAAVLALMAEARRREIATSVDAGSSAFLQNAGSASFRAWTSGCALCFANTEEAAILSATDADYGCRVVTEGAAGASAWRLGSSVRVAGEIVTVRDTAGAGDAFTAGFLAAWMSECDLETCLRRAVRCGALAVGLAGARPTADIAWVMGT